MKKLTPMDIASIALYSILITLIMAYVRWTLARAGLPAYAYDILLPLLIMALIALWIIHLERIP